MKLQITVKLQRKILVDKQVHQLENLLVIHRFAWIQNHH